jgi:hypothetical protein
VPGLNGPVSSATRRPFRMRWRAARLVRIPWRIAKHPVASRGRRGAKRRGYPTAQLLGGPVERGVSRHLCISAACAARWSAARASKRVESSVGNGEFESLKIRGTSVQPKMTASQPVSFILLITPW